MLPVAGSWENQTEVSETGSGSGDLNTTSDTISNITGSYSNSSDLAGGVTGGAVGEQDEMRCPISGEEKVSDPSDSMTLKFITAHRNKFVERCTVTCCLRWIRQ